MLSAEIIERKQVEMDLRESEEHYRVLISSIQMPVLAIRRDLTVRYCNEPYADILGKPIEEIMDKDLLSLVPVLRETQSYAAYNRCFEAKDPQILERQWGGKYLKERLYPTPWGLLVIVDDISERVEAEKAGMQLIQAREGFIASISHDIRTPLFTIGGYLDLMRKGKVNDPIVMQEFLTRASQDVDRLLDMMDEILDISRLDSGGLVLKLEEVDLSTVIGEVLKSLSEKASVMDISMKFDTVNPSLIAEADPSRIRRVLVNLVDNAIKFSGLGRAILVTGESSDGKITIKVTDQGSGIPAADLSRIFDRFSQVRTSTKNISGRGLGLSISKSIIEAHGGSISVQSQLGVGSTFTISIPVKRAM